MPAVRTRNPRTRLGEQPVDPGGRQRRREEVPLPHFTSQVDERLALLDAFDALCYCLQLEGLSQSDDGSCECRLVDPRPDVLDERAGDLDHVDREALQVPE